VNRQQAQDRINELVSQLTLRWEDEQ
jgi:hypothetical protein